MGYSLFLRIPGIPGGCTDEPHKDWIEISSFSQGVARMGEDTLSELHHDFSVAKIVDRASPLLAQACAEGWKIQEAAIEVCRPDWAQAAFMAIRFWDVHLTHFQLNGSAMTGDPSAAPYESLGFRYGKVEWNVEPRMLRPGMPEPRPAVRGSWASDAFEEHPTRAR
jgi:type VI secretion system Hcp family effector